MEKSPQNFSQIGVTDLRLFKKQFSARKQYQKTERQREEIQSRRGYHPSESHGGQGPEGRTSPHLGGGHGVGSRRGSLSPSLSRWRRSATGGTIITAIVFINVAVFTNIVITFLTSFQRSTLLQPAVIPYLNMVLDAIYYHYDDFLRLLCV